MTERERVPVVYELTGHLNFSEQQLRELQATVVNEIAPVLRAKEIYDKSKELTEVGGIWDWAEQVLSPEFTDFFENSERIKYEAKILDLDDCGIATNVSLHTEDPAIRERMVGECQLAAINMENGNVIILAGVKRENPSDTQSEFEGWFGFIVDTDAAEQGVEIFYSRFDDWGLAVHNALLPVLAGEEG